MSLSPVCVMCSVCEGVAANSSFTSLTLSLLLPPPTHITLSVCGVLYIQRCTSDLRDLSLLIPPTHYHYHSQPGCVRARVVLVKGVTQPVGSRTLRSTSVHRGLSLSHHSSLSLSLSPHPRTSPYSVSYFN